MNAICGSNGFTRGGVWEGGYGEFMELGFSVNGGVLGGPLRFLRLV